ncbi:CHAD domain-containing protein [Streptomyces tsukubensis]|uniref:CHAD domain-containing protein n=1 Tax=Streptomyces tsukubensis TaxID=83656 RepID=A0A1V4A8X0_9ACTN|nr:CHAD domain-containing protein [Streptomyces tsukubensis]OON78867.1 hypothetical protein B1H18_16060 [Streptomyces tsukubensis]QFR94346.1 CHAD domain-containing protein [Streptomyces tsukubensis]
MSGPPSEGPGGLPVPAGGAVEDYLRAQATEFLRALRAQRENGPASDEASEAARALRRAARRIAGALHTFGPLLEPSWSDAVRPELAWLSSTLAREHAYTTRLTRLLGALHRLCGGPDPEAAGELPAPAPRSSRARTAVATPSARRAPATAPSATGTLTVGAAKAGALLERQLTLARTRAHSAALGALGSSRFHAVADQIAVLASEVPLNPATASAPSQESLASLATGTATRLMDAVEALPLCRAGHPYNAEALILGGVTPDTAPDGQDAPWHQVGRLLRLHRYAQEVTGPVPGVPRGLAATGLLGAGHALDQHRDAADAAKAAAEAARTPRITPATAYALGVLHADQRHEVEAARFAFQRIWQRGTVTAR